MSKFGRLYYAIVSTAGIFLFIRSAVALNTLPRATLFATLLVLSLLLSTQSIVFNDALSVDLINALALAATPIWGTWPTVFLVIISSILTSIVISFQQKQVVLWPTIRRGVFNVGVLGSSACIAVTLLYQGLLWVGDSFLLQVAIWLLAAIVYDQINLWLVAFIVGFTSDKRPFDVWWGQRWTMPFTILGAVSGGAILYYAMEELGIPGLLAFFVPIAISMYSFRLYVYQSRQKMSELEGIVRERTEELVSLLYEKDAFLGVLRHDMHTILATIRLYTTLLRDKPNLTEENRQRYINIILRSERELLSIADNILEIERLTVNTPLPLALQWFELNSLIDEVVIASTEQAAAKNIKIRLVPTAEPVSIYADKEKCRTILHNILSNSIKYSHHNDVVDLSFTRSEAHVTVKITDYGHGIPAAELDHIFEKYYRLEQHKLQAHGTGLGLAIVHNLVEAHGGRIEVDSTENEGSTFTLHLPLVANGNALPATP